MGKNLDKLIEEYNRSKLQSRKSVSRAKTYSKEVVDDKNLEALIETISKETRYLEKEYKEALDEAENELEESAVKIEETKKEAQKAYRLAVRHRNREFSRIVSPRMYRKVMSYYRKHKGRRYYRGYKIDNDFHSFVMRLGRYLETLENDVNRAGIRGFSTEYHYYALPSLSVLLGSWKEALGYLSGGLVKFYHLFHHPLHILMELAPKIVHSIPVLPGILPHFLVGVLIVALAGGLITIISYAIHPDREAKFKMLKDKTKMALGLYKDNRYAIYLAFIYKLYDILSAIMSSIILIGKNIESNKKVDSSKSAKKLEKEVKKDIGHHGGLIDKVISIFNKDGRKMNVLDEVFSVDLEHYNKLIESIKDGNKDLAICSYKLWLTPKAMNKLAEYYGDKFHSGGEWIEFTVEYQGGAYHKAAKPIGKLKVSGFDGDLKEASKFIAGALALADKIIIDKVGDQEFENGIITINLKALKWLAYKSQPIVAKFVGFIRKLIQTENKITKENISYEMFDSYVIVMKLKALAESEEASQDTEGTEK
jgi:hypothetical protein